jgi:hydroxypyruvate reductase
MQQEQSESALLRQLFERAVQAALPAHALKDVLPKPPKGRTLVLGAGKAAASMALALDELWPSDQALSGLVVTRYDHIPQVKAVECCRIEMLEAAHPVPDQAGVSASERMLALTQGLSSDDLVICLISGGGSSLLTLPVPGLTLEDKRALNQALLKSGANIEEMNCVRKHLSQIKGGRLALACAPAKVVCFAISDVPGDDPAVIASGPTVADPSTCADALAVLAKYKIDIPEQIRQALEQGKLESPKPGADFAHCESVRLIATPKQSLLAAAQLAKSLGLNAYILADDMEGESKDVAKVHAALAREVAKQLDVPDQPSFCAFKAPCVILSGGETTVTISKASSSPDARTDGRGGRAGEFCLSLAKELAEHPRIWAIAADTDGIDGVEANAGAVVLPQTLDKARQQGLNIAAYLSAHDSYSFFEAIGDLVLTGPTYTNVNDFRAILIK